MQSFRRFLNLSLVGAVVLTSGYVSAVPKTGENAPAFTLKDDKDQSHSLSDFSNKFVVLEWYNKDCPFVRKHYTPKKGETLGHMQKLQASYTDKAQLHKKYPGKDVVWLTIVSSGKDKKGKPKEGYMTPAESRSWMGADHENSKATFVLLDTDSKVAHLYGAKTTPHMFVINDKGVLVYAGAIDNAMENNDSIEKADLDKATNYVANALDEAMKDKKVAMASTTPYGCGVKYND
jgi:Redoxin